MRGRTCPWKLRMSKSTCTAAPRISRRSSCANVDNPCNSGNQKYTCVSLSVNAVTPFPFPFDLRWAVGIDFRDWIADWGRFSSGTSPVSVSPTPKSYSPSPTPPLLISRSPTSPSASFVCKRKVSVLYGQTVGGIW